MSAATTERLLREVRIFIACPDDVAPDLPGLEAALGELDRSLMDTTLRVNHWKKETYHAGEHPQEQLVEAGHGPEDAEIVIGIFRSKLGSPLIDSFQNLLSTVDGRGRRRDGQPRTGTEWEIDTALRAYNASGAPHVYLFVAATGRSDVSPTDEVAINQLGLLAAYLNDLRDANSTHKTFESPANLSRLVELAVRDWLDTHPAALPAAQALTSPGEPAPTPRFLGNPYPGLSAYDDDYAPVYFGRERDQQAVRQRVYAGHPGFLCIAGRSGSGKSSLARASFTSEDVVNRGW